MTGIDPRRRVIALQPEAGAANEFSYDRFVLAAGSALIRPTIPGLAEHAFDVDTYGGAERLACHPAVLGSSATGPGRWTAVVIGAGLVGVEIACELLMRLRAARHAARIETQADPVRVVLLDRDAECGSGMGRAAAPAVRAALAAAGVEARGVLVHAVTAGGVLLEGGESIAAGTVLCATGMRASPLAAALGAPLDPLGRVPAHSFLRVESGNVGGVYGVGDGARPPVRTERDT